MVKGGFNNVPATDNPTFEYYPSKGINNGLQIHSPFLHDALYSNVRLPVSRIGARLQMS